MWRPASLLKVVIIADCLLALGVIGGAALWIRRLRQAVILTTDAAAPLPNEWKPSYNPWLIAVSVMLATFMEVLDTSVANVSLPHIAGNLSATTDEATWVLTSYLVANAIILPATNWFGQLFGRKRFLICCIILFTLASALCGLAGSLGFLDHARVLQGAAGGALQPISQAVLLESFPPQKRGMAMAVFTMGVVVAPILGPTIGGWITDNYSLALGLLHQSADRHSRRRVDERVSRRPALSETFVSANIDYHRLWFPRVWLASLQIMLDKGQELDWFGSKTIVWCAVISIAAFIAFIVRELTTPFPMVDLRVLKNRNLRGRRGADSPGRRASLRHDRDPAVVHAEPVELHRARRRSRANSARYRRASGDNRCRSHRRARQQPISDRLLVLC